MRISVNLATRPYVELTPFFARLRLVMAALVLLAIGLAIAQHLEHRKLEDAQAQMDALRNRTIAAQREKLGNEARMRQPANAAVLERAHFLNVLFQRKSFSWTAVMMDLERVLPSGVQVTAIEPAVTTDGDVIIRLRVAGDRDRAVQLVRNLERSSRFLSPRLAAETTQTKEVAANAGANAIPGGVEFDIFANYNPLPPSAAQAAARPPQAPAAKHRAVRVPQPGPGPNDGIVLKPYAAPRQPAGGPQ